MQYGHFDLAAKEYVITRPDTPEPWCNYLGSPAYGAIISNNAGGYSFVQSGANGRISRYRFNSKMSLPGRYIYLRDNDTADYWSATWQPVGKPLDKSSDVNVDTQAVSDPIEDVLDAIDAIGDVTKDSKKAVMRAREIYEELNGTQKSYVHNYDVLKSAEATMKELGVKLVKDPKNKKEVFLCRKF